MSELTIHELHVVHGQLILSCNQFIVCVCVGMCAPAV